MSLSNVCFKRLLKEMNIDINNELVKHRLKKYNDKYRNKLFDLRFRLRAGEPVAKEIEHLENQFKKHMAKVKREVIS